MTEAFFFEDGDRFVATEHTRGPWSPDHQHGGPPAALLGRAIRLAAEASAPNMLVTRITVEFVKPVPIAPLSLRVDEEGGGRSSRRFCAELSVDDVVVCRARASLIRTESVSLPPLPKPPSPPRLPAQCDQSRFPFFRWPVGYHAAIDLRFASGGFGKGPSFAWLSTRLPLVNDETPSPLERVLIAADSGNGVSFHIDPKDYLFINPDLSVHLHRLPVGEWVALDASSTIEATGVGLADTRLWDESGPIGRSAQSLLVGPR